MTAPAVRDVYGEWMSMVGTTYGGRNALPGILWDHFTEGAFTIDQKDDGSPVFDTELLASAVQDAWSMAEYPQQHLTRARCRGRDLLIAELVVAAVAGGDYRHHGGGNAAL